MNTEPFLQKLENGIEVISDDRKLRIILISTTVFFGGMEREIYSSRYFVKDDSGWQECENGEDYESIEDFTEKLKKVTDFTKALKEFYTSD